MMNILLGYSSGSKLLFLVPFLVVVVIVIYIISYLRGDMALCTGNLVDPLMLGFV